VRQLRSSDSLQAWIATTERRLSRMERRGQTTGPTSPNALLAVRTVADIPEDTNPDTTTVYVVETGQTLNFDSVSRVWSPSP
jgi:hypothetical protein